MRAGLALGAVANLKQVSRKSKSASTQLILDTSRGAWIIGSTSAWPRQECSSVCSHRVNCHPLFMAIQALQKLEMGVGLSQLSSQELHSVNGLMDELHSVLSGRSRPPPIAQEAQPGRYTAIFGTHRGDGRKPCKRHAVLSQPEGEHEQSAMQEHYKVVYKSRIAGHARLIRPIVSRS